mmetsp:Transcript_108556/g.312730  ORF Transcript_108556/g.312730 Transcript_108556/m.312730 type:complete len:266 (+) Transcript_108556:272-1069(+)
MTTPGKIGCLPSQKAVSSAATWCMSAPKVRKQTVKERPVRFKWINSSRKAGIKRISEPSGMTSSFRKRAAKAANFAPGCPGLVNVHLKLLLRSFWPSLGNALETHSSYEKTLAPFGPTGRVTLGSVEIICHFPWTSTPQVAQLSSSFTTASADFPVVESVMMTVLFTSMLRTRCRLGQLHGEFLGEPASVDGVAQVASCPRKKLSTMLLRAVSSMSSCLSSTQHRPPEAWLPIGRRAGVSGAPPAPTPPSVLGWSARDLEPEISA